MKKSIVTIALVGLVGVSLAVRSVSPMEASVLFNEQSLAGISLTLDKYYEIALTEEEKQKETKKEEKKEEPIVLNLKYDRLGIAKVDNYLNIRKGAGDDEEIIGKLPKNAGCNVYSVKDGWAKIKSGKVTGYVSSEFLVLDEEAEKYALKVAAEVATVNTTTLNVRYLPDTNSKKYAQVPEGEDLEVLEENLTKKYMDKFIEKNYKGNDSVLGDIDQSKMVETLDDWICVAIDDEKVFVTTEFVDISYKLERAVLVSELSEDGSSGVSSTRAQMVQYAKQFLGNKYVFGGTSLTNGIDCSAFMMRIYQKYGYTGIPRNSRAQAAYSTGISSSNAKPGDLFFYGDSNYISHVGMYIGDGLIIHASNPRSGIKISNAFYRTPIKVGRIIKD
jgi:peptidoglycan DL-endopeptidase CwlO